MMNIFYKVMKKEPVKKSLQIYERKLQAFLPFL